MPRDYAAVNVSIWQDEDWRALPPLAQHLYLTLWTHPQLSYCGVVDWRPGRLAALSGGWTAGDVQEAGDCLRARHFIVVDEDTEECLIRSWVRWDGLMKQPRMAVSYANAFAVVASNLLRRVLVDELHRLHERQPDLAGFGKPQVAAMLDLPSVSAKASVSVEDPFGHGFTHSQGVTRPEVRGSVSVSPTPFSYSSTYSTTPVSAQDPLTSGEDEVEQMSEFDIFWEDYPRKVGKGEARKAYAKARRKATAEALLASVAVLARAYQGQDKTFIPHAATWLNAERWSDEPEDIRPVPTSSVSPKQQQTNDLFARMAARAQQVEDERKAIGQ